MKEKLGVVSYQAGGQGRQRIEMNSYMIITMNHLENE